jgi:hypothetical protein
MSASVPTRIKACLNAMDTSYFTFNQKVEAYECAIGWEGYAYCVLGFSGSAIAHFQKRGENINSAAYCPVLLKLQDATRRKRPGQLARVVLLHHDNARTHTARATHWRIQELQWELLEHPPYSPDLAPSDFCLFGLLKKHLGDKL